MRDLVDDGFTGTNFNTPNFARMIEMVEQDKIGTLVVKDLSRLGREYLQIYNKSGDRRRTNRKISKIVKRCGVFAGERFPQYAPNCPCPLGYGSPPALRHQKESDRIPYLMRKVYFTGFAASYGL